MSMFALLRSFCVAALLASVVATGQTPLAATDHAGTIDQIRDRARQMEESKQILSDPDQTVRLAAFEAMVLGDDDLMREMAIDAGLASTDELLRALALKHALLGLGQLSITLAVDESAPKAIQERSRAYLEKNGRSYLLKIEAKRTDLRTGLFGTGGASYKGNVSGFVVTFDYGPYAGELYLQDDNALAGTLYSTHGGTNQFKASAPLR
jgi:hypothetical protein